MPTAQDIIDEIDAEDFDDMDIKYVNVTNPTDSQELIDEVSLELKNAIHQELTTPLDSPKRKTWVHALLNNEIDKEELEELDRLNEIDDTQ